MCLPVAFIGVLTELIEACIDLFSILDEYPQTHALLLTCFTMRVCFPQHCCQPGMAPFMIFNVNRGEGLMVIADSEENGHKSTLVLK